MKGEILMQTTLYVGNISSGVTEEDLRSLFTKIGMVNEVAMVKNRNTGKSARYAYVTMNSQEDAEKAIQQYSGRSVNNTELIVILARPREQRPWSTYDSNHGSGNQSNISQNQNDGSQSG